MDETARRTTSVTSKSLAVILLGLAPTRLQAEEIVLLVPPLQEVAAHLGTRIIHRVVPALRAGPTVLLQARAEALGLAAGHSIVLAEALDQVAGHSIVLAEALDQVAGHSALQAEALAVLTEAEAVEDNASLQTHIDRGGQPHADRPLVRSK